MLLIDIDDLIEFFDTEAKDISDVTDVLRYLRLIKESLEEIDDELANSDKSKST